MIHIDPKKGIYKIDGKGADILGEIALVIVKIAEMFADDNGKKANESLNMVLNLVQKGARDGLSFQEESRRGGRYEQ